MAETEQQALTKLMEAIKIQGDKVRELKTSGAAKDTVDVEVKKLLELKAKLPKEEKKPKEKKVDQRALKKEQRRLARMAKQKKEIVVEEVTSEQIEQRNFGPLSIHKSKPNDKLGRKFFSLSEIAGMKPDTTETAGLWVRARVHTLRSQSKICFVVLREKVDTIQAIVGEKDAAKFTATIPPESVVDVLASLKSVPNPTKATISNSELQVLKIFIVSKASSQLPFQVVDASRPESEFEKAPEEQQAVRVGLDTRLEHRCLDLRTPLSQSIVKITSQVLYSFRDHLFHNGFTEICSPKLLGGASEGGAEVFGTDYFGTEAFLAQSPQLHKQMSAACSGLRKVFEVGPVFRAENSNTNRHLCEFTGLDVEMCINEHYHEILDVFSDLFHRIFDDLEQLRAKEMAMVRTYYNNEPVVYKAPDWIDASKISGVKARTLRIEFGEAIQMLREAGVDEETQPEFDDLSTPVEKKLGELVKKKYGVDFYFLDKFPYAPRPFYTMPCPVNPKLSNSYDFFIRGQEIMSGAQRVHDPTLLEEKVKEKDVPTESLRFYIDAFKQGALPHGGGGVGLERVVMLFLGLPNIRQVRLFPRDPQRLMP